LSLPFVASFGTAFGGFGTLFETVGFGPIVTPILAAVFAVLVSGGLYVVMLILFVKSQAETRVDLATLVGYKGQVMIPIRPGQPGQIVVVRKRADARCCRQSPTTSLERMSMWSSIQSSAIRSRYTRSREGATWLEKTFLDSSYWQSWASCSGPCWLMRAATRKCLRTWRWWSMVGDRRAWVDAATR